MTLLKSVGRIIFYAGLFVAGYTTRGCIEDDSRYDVRMYGSKPFLVDKKLGNRIEISNENGRMSLGDLEYRVETLIDSNGVKEVIEGIKRKMERK